MYVLCCGVGSFGILFNASHWLEAVLIKRELKSLAFDCFFLIINFD